MPRFSAIIPCYNRATLIGRTLQSVQDQTFRDYEIIVVDDGSTDDSARVVEQFSQVKLIRQPNLGPGAARNRGIAEARGDYVAFLDSDDLWFPWTLEVFQEALRQFSEPAVVSGREINFNDEATLQTVVRTPSAFDPYEDLLKFTRKYPAAWLPPSASAVRTDALRASGGYPSENLWGEDSDLWLKLGTTKGFVRVLEPAMNGMRHHPQNITKITERCVRGLNFLIDSENKGLYAGGAARRLDRQNMITFPIRNCSVRCLHEGRIGMGMSLYWRTFAWHIHLGRLKYLAAFPLMAAWNTVIRRSDAPAAGKESTGGAHP